VIPNPLLPDTGGELGAGSFDALLDAPRRNCRDACSRI